MRRDLADHQFRAITTRKVLGYATQKAFCEELGLDTSVWNLVEKGKRIINLSQARAIKKGHQISLDWTLDGDLHALSKEQQKKVRLALVGKEFSTEAA
jgi:hypothetical protein